MLRHEIAGSVSKVENISRRNFDRLTRYQEFLIS